MGGAAFTNIKNEADVERVRVDSQNEEAHQVCFSKRHNGLFKKAIELSSLCGVEIVVIFSPADKVFSFGHPSVEWVVDRFLAGNRHRQPSPTESHREAAVRELNW
ncbi:agamous-like MADS-box protein AGL62 [Canna indica]|uniref:Agamous-like MADS-box protein AGL62 n=1 Tax=Canna indica TaxID=4628 RepID=A0AAQ3Q8W5_9LILI|nr:agamous-like MADS-box protein AGL62 [Canna indica]